MSRLVWLMWMVLWEMGLAQEKACTESDESCYKHNDPACGNLIKFYREGRIKRGDLISKMCGPKQFCCPTKVVDENSPSYLPSGAKEECGLFRDLTNIVGGNVTKPGRYPFAVALGIVDKREIRYICGGTLINRWYVLTAAHCNKNNRLKSLGIANIGDWKISTTEDCVGPADRRRACLPPNQLIRIKEFTSHQDYNLENGVKNDIALVKLSSPAEYNYKSVYPACLPWGEPDRALLEISNFRDELIDVRALAVGWGKTLRANDKSQDSETSSRADSDEQMAVELPILSEAQCLDQWNLISGDQQICAGGEKGRDSCNGDSGGPLVISRFNKRSKFLTPDIPNSRWYLVGIVSYGTQRCGTGQPGVFTRVSAYTDWIRENMI